MTSRPDSSRADRVLGAEQTGLDPAYLWAWFDRHADGPVAPLEITLLTGGKSNLTFRVRDADGRAWALRRPPLSSILKSAHDMGREYRILAALQTTEVPVPEVVGYDDGAEAPFYVTTFVDGLVVRGPGDAEALAPEARATTGRSLAAVLADLHAVDLQEVDLETLSSHRPYVARQLRRWIAQWEQQRTRELPLIGEVHRRLERSAPPQRATTLAHGDFKLANAIVGPDGRVKALLDWELCTLGDPLADVGLFLAYWPDPDEASPLPSESAPTHLAGFVTQAELVATYTEHSGRPIEDVAFYVALAYWKLAVILEGVYGRWTAGAYGAGTVPDEIRGYPDAVERLAHAARDTLDGRGASGTVDYIRPTER